MQIELSSDLLKSSESKLSLIGLLAHGFSGRHVVLVDPREEGASSAYEAWREELGDPKLKEEIKWVLDEGDRRASVGTRVRLKVSSVSNSASSVLLEKALLLCSYPYRVLLENGVTDRDFLLVVAGPHRDALNAASEKGWLLFETAGGIDGVKMRVEELGKQIGAGERFYCLVDSDAKDEKTSSEVALTIQTSINAIAKKIGVAPAKIGKVLERRSVENYVEIHALQSWLKKQMPLGMVKNVEEAWKRANDVEGEPLEDSQRGTPGSKERALFAALALEDVSDRIWNFFDFSKGRGRPPRRTVDSVWSELSKLQQSALEDGFSKSLLRAFYLSPNGKTDPSADAELQEIITSIQERQ